MGTIKRRFTIFRAASSLADARNPAPAAAPAAASDNAPRRTAMEWLAHWAAKLAPRPVEAVDPDALGRSLRAKRGMSEPATAATNPTQATPLAPNAAPALANVPVPDLAQAIRASRAGRK